MKNASVFPLCETGRIVDKVYIKCNISFTEGGTLSLISKNMRKVNITVSAELFYLRLDDKYGQQNFIISFRVMLFITIGTIGSYVIIKYLDKHPEEEIICITISEEEIL